MVPIFQINMGLVSMIDNTFASPVKSKSYRFCIDIVIHSAQNIMGGTIPIFLCGCGLLLRRSICATHPSICQKRLGGSLSDYTVWLLEKKYKTNGELRVKRAQNENAHTRVMADYLYAIKIFRRILIPDCLQSGHDIAQKTNERILEACCHLS